MRKISEDYIRGLTEGEGCFTFYPVSDCFFNKEGEVKKLRRPAFIIRIHERDRDLLGAVLDVLDLDDKVYWWKPWVGDGVKRGPSVGFIIRDTLKLRNTIIPFFYKNLHGYKGKQFLEWLEKMGEEDKTVESRYLHRLYKEGFFEKYNKDAQAGFLVKTETLKT